jgi:hypothetical protein
MEGLKLGMRLHIDGKQTPRTNEVIVSGIIRSDYGGLGPRTTN